MKKVYLLYQYNGCSKSLVAIYGSRESAEAAKDKWLENDVVIETEFAIECWQIN